MKTSRKSVNIFELLLSFCAAKSYEFVPFIQKITLLSCDVSLECAAIL